MVGVVVDSLDFVEVVADNSAVLFESFLNCLEYSVDFAFEAVVDFLTSGNSGFEGPDWMTVADY